LIRSGLVVRKISAPANKNDVTLPSQLWKENNFQNKQTQPRCGQACPQRELSGDIHGGRGASKQQSEPDTV